MSTKRAQDFVYDLRHRFAILELAQDGIVATSPRLRIETQIDLTLKNILGVWARSAQEWKAVLCHLPPSSGSVSPRSRQS